MMIFRCCKQLLLLRDAAPSMNEIETTAECNECGRTTATISQSQNSTMLPYRECSECHTFHYYDPENDVPCDECLQNKQMIAVRESNTSLVSCRTCGICNEPVYYIPSEDSRCDECGRTMAKVASQARNPRLLPYGTCSACDEPNYFKPNKKYVEKDEDYGTVLASDCYYEMWDAVRERVKLFPKEAKPVPYRDSALYLATSFQAPQDVIHAIALAYPKAISSPRVLSGIDWTPMHEFLFGCDLDMEALKTFKLLQRLDPNRRGLEVGDEDDENALEAIWYRIWNAVEHSLERGSSLEEDPTPFDLTIEWDGEINQDEFRVGWKIFCRAYKGLYYREVRGRKQSILRALAGCHTHYECPDMALRFAIKMYPEELKRTNKTGNFPLHIAAKSKQWARAIPDDCSWYEPPSHPLPRAPYKAEQIRILAEASPQAAQIRNLQGSLPLHLAIKAGRKWDGGVQSILETYPAAVISKDGESGLFPFMLAAMFANERECCDLEVNDWDDKEVDHTVDLTYRLLRACPELDRFGDWRQQSGVRDVSKLAKVSSLLSCLIYPLRSHSRSKEGV